MSESTPKLWSDFDGTAVAKYGFKNPRNWSKYPLPGIPGYLNFLLGTQQAGVEFAGVVTIRKEAVRRAVTNRSIRKLNYSLVISPNMVAYAGTEEAKGRFIAKQSLDGTVGMIDDKPHKFGIALLEALAEPLRLVSEPSFKPILLGVVSQGRKSQEYIERLAEQAKSVAIDGLEVTEAGPITSSGLSIRAQHLVLDVVQLAPYSRHTGEAFGQRLQDLAAA